MSDTTVDDRTKAEGSLAPSLEGLLLEQVNDWMRGERSPLKVYLDRQPAIRDRPDVLVELSNQEVVLRQMRGETPRPEDYLGEFPELSDSLVRLFEVQAAASLPTVWRGSQGLADSPIDPGTQRDNIARATRIPVYEIERVLGRGGMGVVYLARHQALNRKVALKLLQEGRQDDPAHRARFEREAAAVARCQHPHLVQIHEIGEYDGQSYLALEYVEGGTLARALAGAPQPPRFAAALVETLARAIDHAHAHGVVHRDLKPSNILLTPDGQPKITDFGLAKLKDSSVQTEERTLLGTLEYMSPEQVRGESEAIGPGVDIHALGSILYEVLTGRPPYRAATPPQIIHAILSEEVVAPSTRLPGIPRDLEAICLKCLEKDPKDRYATAADLAEDLRRFLDGRVTAARPASRAERCVRWCRRNPWAAAFLVAMGLGVIGSTWQAVRATQAERKTREEAAISEALNEFLQMDVLAQASAYHQARPNIKPDSDLKVRTALDRASATIGDRFGGQPLVEAAIRLTIGETYYRLGLYEQARPHLERALELRRRERGDRDPDTLTAMIKLGELLHAEGHGDQALPLFLEGLKGLRKARGEMHLSTLEAMANLGALYHDENRFDEVEPLMDRAVKGLRMARGPDHPDTLEAMINLGINYRERKKLREAKTLLEEAVAGLKKVRGPDHPSTLVGRAYLDTIYLATGERQKSESLLKEVLERQRQVLGADHPQTLHTMVMLGELYTILGKIDEAESILEAAVERCLRTLGEEHPDSVLAMALLAPTYIGQRKLEKAELLLTKSVDFSRRKWGDDDGMVAGGSAGLGQLCLKLRKFSKAETYLRVGWLFYTKAKPEDWNRFAIESLLGESLLGQKRYAEAEPLLLAGYNGLKAREPSIPPQNKGAEAETMDRIIDLYKDWDKKDKLDEWRNRRADLVFSEAPLAPP